jgi:tetratricopeptide (TPR) repeat protein
LRNLGDYEGA